MREVDVHVDFVSPYAYLALTQIEAFAATHGVRFRPRPVVYGALLDHHGLVGPAETPAKRRYTFVDASRGAALLGVPLVGPPAHPFRSLDALRVVCCHLESPRLVPLVVGLARACWAEGRDLTSPEVLAEVVSRAGLDPGDLSARIQSVAVKDRLKEMTSSAIAAGVFGVPTFVLDGELFWGHDRLPHLAARLSGMLPDASLGAEAMLSRPRGSDRRALRVPDGGSGHAGSDASKLSQVSATIEVAEMRVALADPRRRNDALRLLEGVIVDRCARLVPDLARIVGEPDTVEDTNRFASLLVDLPSGSYIEPLMAAISTGGPDLGWVADYLYALGSLLDDLEEPPSVGEDFVHLLGRWLLTTGGGEISWKAGTILALVDHPATRSYLEAGARDQNRFHLTRTQCLAGIMNHHREHAPGLIAAIENDPNDKVRAAARDARDWLASVAPARSPQL